MENVDQLVELPREEQLVRLYEMTSRIERAIAARSVDGGATEADRHLREFGHRLAFGCCRHAA